MAIRTYLDFSVAISDAIHVNTSINKTLFGHFLW